METGEVFDSMTAAGKSIGSSGFRTNREGGGSLHHTSISHAIHGHGGVQKAGGYHWEFVDEPNNVRRMKHQLHPEEALPKIYKTIKRKPPKQEKEDYPPEGYVYVFRNRWHPEGVYKIGSTDNLEGRRAAARTWGAYNCEYYLEVDDCKLVESMVHTKLKDRQIEAGDLGQEHFDVDLEEATSIIKDVAFEAACMHKDCAA
jgi:hypothetical protein